MRVSEVMSPVWEEIAQGITFIEKSMARLTKIATELNAPRLSDRSLHLVEWRW